ncbi:MAG: FtsX-like permease family protein [Planctomycetota bacterium]|nr:FtsX-like permease family protein [Planctomycetota bacterium]
MSLTSFVVSKSWASNPLRTALTVLGIALGVGIVVAIYVMDHNTIQSQFLKQNQNRGPVDLEVMAGRKAPASEILAELAEVPGVSDVAVWRECRAVLEVGEQAKVDVRAFGLSPLPAGVFAHYALAAGRDLRPEDAESAVLLGRDAADKLGVAKGARITVRQPAGGRRYECRDGQLVEIEAARKTPFATEVVVAGVLERHLIGRRNFGDVMVCGYELASRLHPGAPDWFHLQRVYGADVDRLRQELAGKGYVVADERSAHIGQSADERAFRNGLKILGCLALLLGMFVVFQTLSHSLVTRVRLLGLLRCLGTGRGAVGRIFLGEALMLGICGSAVGLLIGIALAALLRLFNISSLGGGKEWLTFELPVLPMLWTAGIGVVFTLAGAAFPLWRARSMPALWILRQRGLSRAEDGETDLLRGVNTWLFVLLIGVLPLAYLAMTPLVAEEGRETLLVLLEMGGMVLAIGGLLLLAPVTLAIGGRVLLWPVARFVPLASWLCRKSVDRQSGRIAAGVVGLSAVLLAFLGLKSLTTSLRGDVREFAVEALNQRAFVEVPASTAESCADWAEIPGVAAVEPIEGEVAGPFLLRGLAVEHAASRGGALEGHQDLVRRYAGTKARTLVASRRLALKMGWKPGTLVALRDRNQVPVSYEVLWISDASGYVPSEQAWAITSPYWLRKDFCIGEVSVTSVTLKFDRGADAGFVNQQLNRLVPGKTGFRRGSAIREYHLRDVHRDFYLFDLLLFMILVLAGTGLLNGMTIAALGRGRELGVLRALGVDRKTLRSSLLLEGVLVGALAAGLALALVSPMAELLVAGLNRVAALDVPLMLPVGWMWAVLPLAVSVGVLSAWFPAARAGREDPAVAIRYE